MKYYIYKITFESGKTYVGSHIEKIENDGYITSSSYYKGHPEDKIAKREILCYTKTREQMYIMETIAIYDDRCYNEQNVNGNIGNWHSTQTYIGFFGKHSEKEKALISERTKEALKDPKIREKIIKTHLGRKNTEATKQLMSESAKKSWTEERLKNAIESGNYSHPHSEETKQFMSEFRKDRKFIYKDGAQKSVKPDKLQSYIDKGWTVGHLPFSDETRKKMSEAAKERCKRHSNSLGRKWVHKGQERKYIKSEELQNYLNDGWLLGMPSKNR